MKKKLLCLLFSLLLVATPAQAAEKPNAAVDTSRSCTLILQYATSGQAIRLYRAAELSSDGTYMLCGAFTEYDIHMPAGNSQAQWDALRDTLLSYIAADTFAPDYTTVTDAEGRAMFTDLPVGLYLVDKAEMPVDGSTWQYAAALLAVPGADGNGNWTYDVTSAPKHAEKGGDTDTPVTYTVVKLWADETSSSARPDGVEIIAYKDGVEQGKQTLSSANDWTYQWTASEGEWSVLEHEVPAGYTVSVRRSGSTFFITNTGSGGSAPVPAFDGDEGEFPKTGDEFHLTLYAALATASGLALLLLGVTGRKQQHEK